MNNGLIKNWAKFSSVLLIGMLQCACSDSHKPEVRVNTPYAAMARGKVDIDGGLLSVVAPRAGIFNVVLVKAGQKVQRGDVLGRLNSDATDMEETLAKTELQHAKAEQAVLESRLPAAKKLAQRWQAAATAGAAEQQQADDANQASQQLQAEITVAQSAVALAAQKIHLAQYERDVRTLRAPQNAEVIKVLVQPGSSTDAQAQPVFILQPEKPLVVRAEVNESFIGLIHNGMKASVSFESNPERAPVAMHVVRIGRVIEQSRLGDDQPQTGRIVECILEFDNAQDLRIGQNVLVKFHDR
jgi:multidrug resistance efflux pump